MKLAGQIALVTRASRRAGKGIALGLGEAGATVYDTALGLALTDGDRSALLAYLSTL